MGSEMCIRDSHRPEQEEHTDHGHHEPDQSKEQLPDRISRSRLDHRKVRFLWINSNRDRESAATLPPVFRNRELPLVLRLPPQPLPCDKEPGASITRGGGERPTAQNFGVHRDTTPPHPHPLHPQSDPAPRARKPSKKEHQSEEQTDQKNQHLEYIGQTRLLDESPGEADAWLFWGDLRLESPTNGRASEGDSNASRRLPQAARTGAGCRTRTDDLLFTREMLYQLS